MIKYFIITLDTEGDNAWDRRSITTVKNAEYLPRFQKLCDKYNFKPTYLTNYEMAKSKHFIELGKSIILDNRGEIGMHLHAWDSPPDYSLTDKDWHHHPYLIEYPQDILIKKIKYILNTTVGFHIRIHLTKRPSVKVLILILRSYHTFLICQ